MACRKETKIKSNFSKISIGLASPEEILENSSGEVLKPETCLLYTSYAEEGFYVGANQLDALCNIFRR